LAYLAGVRTGNHIQNGVVTGAEAEGTAEKLRRAHEPHAGQGHQGAALMVKEKGGGREMVHTTR